MKCIICSLPINKKDAYVRVTDYLKAKKQAEAFFHRKCYNERVLDIKKQNEKQDKILNQAKGMLDSLGLKLGIMEEKEVIIP